MEKMGKKALMLPITILIALVVLSTPVLATYSGSAQSSPWTYPACKIYVKIDVQPFNSFGLKVINLRWEGPPGILLPLPGLLLGTSWKITDDFGFVKVGWGAESGEVTVGAFYTGTWVHVTVCWHFMVYPGQAFLLTYANVDLYVPPI